MTNSILEIRHQVRSLTPANAEVWFTIVCEHVSPTTEVRGRVVGPHCPSHSTIEIAYPLQRPAGSPTETPFLTARVVIPEPSLWKPDAPFLYRVHVELWEDNERCAEKEFDLGLRTRE
jgi:hypothetical protein